MKRLLLFLSCWLLFSLALFAQDELPPRATEVLAFTNARIVQAPGMVIENGTILVKHGKIEAVGNSVSIPANASIIKADSLTIYAGFIDGLSNTGVPKPKTTPLPRIPEPGYPTLERSGVTPHIKVIDMLDASEKSIQALRDVGFTIAHVVPYGQMMPGQSALILLGGDSVNDMILNPQFAQFAQFARAARGENQTVYPSNLLGIMAQFRQAFKSSKVSQQYDKVLLSGGQGMARNTYNPAIHALYPVLDRKMSVFFQVEDALNAQRAIKLAKELNFSMMIAGIKDGWEIKDEALAYPLFLSLDIPEDSNKLEKDSTLGMIEIKRTVGPSDTEQELKQLKIRQLEVYNQYVNQAKTLASSGVIFGFTTQGTDTKNIRKNLQKMVSEGLSENDALAALTTLPASLLGISNLAGSLEEGKLANFVITDGSYFDEKSSIRYVVIDGTVYEYEAKPKNDSSTSNGTSSKFAGEWTWTVETGGDTQSGTLTLKQNGTTYSGTLYQESQEDALQDISVQGNQMTFVVSTVLNNTPMVLEFDLELEGNVLAGTVEVGNFGVFPFTANRPN